MGNTNPGSTDEIIKEVLMKCADSLPAELKLKEPLEILEVTCLTKQSAGRTPLRIKCWKVKVANKCREHMMKDEAFPCGWSHLRFFPKSTRTTGSGVPPLEPLLKKPNMGQDVSVSETH